MSTSILLHQISDFKKNFILFLNFDVNLRLSLIIVQEYTMYSAAKQLGSGTFIYFI